MLDWSPVVSRSGGERLAAVTRAASLILLGRSAIGIAAQAPRDNLFRVAARDSALQPSLPRARQRAECTRTSGGNDSEKATVTGTGRLDGTLNIVLADGFVPNLGDTFQIMTCGSAGGTFATVTGADIGGGEQFAVPVGATSVTLEVVSS